jgi:hypothetical protein
MPLYEAAIRHTMHTSGNGAAEQLAINLCKMQADEAKRYIAQLQRSRASDTIVNHPSTKWDDN